jgi:glycine/D-amino acid oxidase-like deaminating enzyme/nitrite reductase/ring-hydroxylating ferredoxin subunit
MKETPMTKSVWTTPGIPALGRLTANRSADVCVIGGGLAGLTTAYLLAHDGHDVIVLDSEQMGMAESVRTTAHLVTALDRGWTELLAVHGDVHARRAAASHAAAIDRIERLIADEGIDCDFRRVDGFLYAAPADDPKRLADELQAAHAAGLVAVEMQTRGPLSSVAVPCLRFPAQARLEPGEYLRGLAAAAVRRGATLIDHTPVVDVTDDGALKVHTAAGNTITAGSVVTATNTPITTRVAFHAKQAAYRTYVLAFAVPRGAVPDALYWDQEDPFHYVRLATGAETSDLLIVGGEDHKTGQDEDGPDARFTRLEAWARAHFPRVAAVTACWSGQVFESMDGLAFIGPVRRDSRVYAVTGDSGNGYTHGTIAAMMFADMITGRPTPWAETYDPGRVRVRALGDFAVENINVARQMTDWVARGDVSDVDEIPADSGAIVRRGIVPVAIYRDPGGRLHELSAACPHLGCIVHWNRGERSWDCPCHGSRFDAIGHVLNGPATRGLRPHGDAGEPHRPPAV